MSGADIESTASWPPPPPPPMAGDSDGEQNSQIAILRQHVRRRLVFPEQEGADDDDDEQISQIALLIEPSYIKAHDAVASPPQTPPPPCACGRGPCSVVRRPEGYQYVCSARLKCNFTLWCDEAGSSQRPASRNIVQAKHQHAVSSPSNQRYNSTSPINLNQHSASKNQHRGHDEHLYVLSNPSNQRRDAMSPVDLSQQNDAFKNQHPVHPEHLNAVGSPSNQRCNVVGPVNLNQQKDAFKNQHPVQPEHPNAVGSPCNQRCNVMSPVNRNQQNNASKNEHPFCSCGAGKCLILQKQGRKYYGCHLTKGYGACGHFQWLEPPEAGPGSDDSANGKLLNCNLGKETNNDQVVEDDRVGQNGLQNCDLTPEDDEWPFEIDDNGELIAIDDFRPSQKSPNVRVIPASPRFSPKRQHLPNAAAETPPTKRLVPPNGITSPVTPKLGKCFGCGEEGHWLRDCTAPRNSPCFKCGEVGHWMKDCTA